MKGIILTIALITLSVTGVFAKSNDLDGKQWTLTYANGREVTSSLAYFEIERNSERFVGSTGCNRMFGSVEVTNQRIDFSNIGTTKMMCKLPAGSVSETAFLNALEKAEKYAQNGNVLYMFDRGGRTVLRFKRLVKQPPVPVSTTLENKKWVLESIKGRQYFVPIKGVFMNFDASKDGVGGNSGCNVFGGKYKATGSRIEISKVISTMRACVEDGKMTTEREFFDGLRVADRYEIRDGRLFLYKGRKLMLTLRGEAKS